MSLSLEEILQSMMSMMGPPVGVPPSSSIVSDIRKNSQKELKALLAVVVRVCCKGYVELRRDDIMVREPQLEKWAERLKIRTEGDRIIIVVPPFMHDTLMENTSIMSPTTEQTPPPKPDDVDERYR